MRLMYKNEEACRINTKTGEVKIANLGIMPLSLYLEESADVDSRVNNLMNFNHWCASRVLSLDREYAKEILNSCMLSQGTTDKEKSDVAQQYRCLSLQDQYWTQNANESLDWENINLFDNSLGNAIVDVALTGKNISITNTMLIAPDCSTNGVFPKAWVREEDGFWLYKGDRNDSVTKEVEASKILQKLGLEVLGYAYKEWNGNIVSASKCFTSKDTGYIAVDSYIENNDLPARTDEYYTMILADYLVGNSDRHWGNWGFCIDSNRNLTPAPIMDFNHAFEAKPESICKPEMLYGETKAEIEAAYEASKHIRYKRESLKEFKYGAFVENRLIELEAYRLNKEIIDMH